MLKAYKKPCIKFSNHSYKCYSQIDVKLKIEN